MRLTKLELLIAKVEKRSYRETWAAMFDSAPISFRPNPIPLVTLVKGK